MNKSYIDNVRVLLESLPVIFETPHFAMKGGTAINLLSRECRAYPLMLMWFTPTTPHHDQRP